MTTAHDGNDNCASAAGTTTTIPPAAPIRTSTSASTRAKIAGGPTPEVPYPIKMNGTVIKGFGRGSKDLGIPTGMLSISFYFYFIPFALLFLLFIVDNCCHRNVMFLCCGVRCWACSCFYLFHPKKKKKKKRDKKKYPDNVLYPSFFFLSCRLL
jgi:hypothetical protein